MNSKSKQESKLLWQYYWCKFLPWWLTLTLKMTLNISAWAPFHVWTWKRLFMWGFRAAARMWKRDYVMLTSKYSPSKNDLVPHRVRGAVFDRGGHIVSHNLLKAWARPQLANLTEYAVREGYVKAHWQSMLMQNNWQILMDYKGRMFFPKADQEWISPHVVRMEARSIKSKQLGLLSRPALLKFEVSHGSMSECV